MQNRWLFASLVLLTCAFMLPAQAQTANRCFSETSFCIAGPIREYWEENGGLVVFGLPKGPQKEELIEGKPYQVQWFERNRLELHPENKPPYHVLLGRLGAGPVEAAKQAGTWQPPAAETAQASCLHYSETGWNVCGAILQAYRASGLEVDKKPGLSYDDNKALFGLPLTPLVTMQLEGKAYQVQWFERARFELHPENQSPYNVLLGLLGNETLSNAKNSPPKLTLAPSSGHKITIKTVEEDRADPKRHLKISFPFLEETDSQAQAFHEAVVERVKEAVDNFEKDMASWEVAPEAPGENSLQIDPQVTLNSNDLISVLFIVDTYMQGAAHPSHYSFGLNYQFSQAKALTLADLFQPQTKYLEQIAAYCIQELRKRPDVVFENFAEEGAAPLEKNYKSWNLTPQGLLINFDYYQVAPYAAGMQQVTVPYSELQTLAKPQGPLAALLN